MPCKGCQNRGVYENNQGSFHINKGYTKLASTDWIAKYENRMNTENLVEIQFKNTRKEYYLNPNSLLLKSGDIVAVESQYGHDVGTVTLTSNLVWAQLKKKRIDLDRYVFRKIYRKATYNDLQKWKEAMDMEHRTMIQTRQIVNDLGLEMKVGDVEFQGDKSKAIFYYIAEDRIDFRELIKILARKFRIRVEMKQIGSRQEAGRIGGIGSCGRELCCSSWKTDFNSVLLSAAKVQELPSNAQKLAGQCGKLKCCLMYELDSYIDAREAIPKVLLELQTAKGVAYHHKTDILRRIMYYSYERDSPENLIPVPVERVKEIIDQNKRGINVEQLVDKQLHKDQRSDYIAEITDINRFDPDKKKHTNAARNRAGESTGGTMSFHRNQER